MRLSKITSAALAIGIIVSLLLIVPIPARAAPAGPSAIRPLVDNVFPTTAYGGITFNFETGASFGRVYFQAFDNSGDRYATVAIHDQNYTRDRLANPVVSWNVSFATSTYNYSYTYGRYLQLPFSLQSGGWWNITITAALAGFSSTNFYVNTYLVFLSSQAAATIASGTMTEYYRIVSTVNETPYSLVTSLHVTGSYSTSAITTANLAPFNVGVSGASGQFTVSVPSNAYDFGYVFLTVQANTSSGNSQYGYGSFGVGYLAFPTFTLQSCAPPCTSFTTTFPANNPIYVTVQQNIVSVYGTVPAVGSIVGTSFYNTVARVYPPGAPTGPLTTNSSGGVGFVFQATSTNFTLNAWNSIHFTVTDAYNPAIVTFYNDSFYLYNYRSFPAVQLTLDKSQYYSGDTATVNWVVGGFGSSSSGWSASYWQAFNWNTGSLLAQGTLTGTASSGSFPFVIPLTFVGNFGVYVQVHNATEWFYSNSVTGAVLPPLLTLQPSELMYLPGDTVTFTVQTGGSAFAGSTLWYAIQDGIGNPVANGTVTGGAFQLHIPSVETTGSFTASVWAVAPGGAVIATASSTIAGFFGLVLRAGMDTPSSYADGSYQSGQSVSVRYSIAAYGGASVPQRAYLYIFPGFPLFSSIYGLQSATITSASGTVGYTIPSGVPNGAQTFSVLVVIPGCNPVCAVFAAFAVPINNNPSVLSLEVPAGSGLTVAWIILLVLVVIVGAVLFVLLRRRGRPVVMHPATTPPPSPPPAAWSERGGPGEAPSDSPPMPNAPPPGAG